MMLLTALTPPIAAQLPPAYRAGLLNWMHTLVTLALIAGLFAAMFRFLPDAPVRWSDVWLGALVTALLFALGNFLVGLYLGHSNLASVFGAGSSLAVILIWIYYAAMVVLFGAKFTFVWSQRREKAPPAAASSRARPRPPRRCLAAAGLTCSSANQPDRDTAVCSLVAWTGHAAESAAGSGHVLDLSWPAPASAPQDLGVPIKTQHTGFTLCTPHSITRNFSIHPARSSADPISRRWISACSNPNRIRGPAARAAVACPHPSRAAYPESCRRAADFHGEQIPVNGPAAKTAAAGRHPAQAAYQDRPRVLAFEEQQAPPVAARKAVASPALRPRPSRRAPRSSGRAGGPPHALIELPGIGEELRSLRRTSGAGSPVSAAHIPAACRVTPLAS